MPQPYKLFTIYAREDAQYLEELRGQLRPLEIAGRIRIWNDREINPGVDWEKEIVRNLDTADIILILVSAAYYNSAYIHEKEIKYALDRHERGEAKVLPVIVRPCSFLDDPVISRLQVLPSDGKPVTSHHWRERDDAWVDVVAGVKRTLDLMRDAENRREQEKQDAAERAKQAAERQKEDEKRAREAEADARERSERAREEAARRTAEEQDRRRRETEASRLREAQLKQEREERERLEQQQREQEDAYRRADSAAWLQAAAAHHIEAYESYLTDFPLGDMAKEARTRIRALKRESGGAVPLKRYATIGGGALALLLAFWLLPKMFGGHDTGENTALQPATETKETSDPNRKSGFELVSVQGGTFKMGSPGNEAGRFDDECLHAVTVGSFSIGKYEVTQADWREIMGSDPPELSFKGCDDCPVESVSWDDIQTFLQKLNARYSGKNYRLPTEAEWEYAARGGQAGENTYFPYAGGDDLGEVAWYFSNSDSKTHPVGGKKANQLGLFDMSGNVWEWCQDTYKPYPCDNINMADGSYRVFRGGGWLSVPRFCRSAHRYRLPPTYRNYDLGFRLASSSF